MIAKTKNLRTAIQEVVVPNCENYKFKILTTNTTGTEFIVLAEIGRDVGGRTNEFPHVAELIVGTSKMFDLVVKGVYWRLPAYSKPRYHIPDFDSTHSPPRPQSFHRARPAPSKVEVDFDREMNLFTNRKSSGNAQRNSLPSQEEKDRFSLALSGTQYGGLD